MTLCLTVVGAGMDLAHIPVKFAKLQCGQDSAYALRAEEREADAKVELVNSRHQVGELRRHSARGRGAIGVRRAETERRSTSASRLFTRLLENKTRCIA